MISAGDFRNGLTVLIEGNIYSGIPACKTGKGSSFR